MHQVPVTACARSCSPRWSIWYWTLLYTHQCSQSWYCRFHRVWSDAPDYHTVVFWIHITPLWNWWCSTQCFSQYTRHEVLWRRSYRTVQICTKYFICFKLKPLNHTPKHKRKFLMQLEWFSTQDIVCIEKLTWVHFKMCSSLVKTRWTVDPKYLFQSFSIKWEGVYTVINLLLLQ